MQSRLQSRYRLARLFVLAIVMFSMLSACSSGPYRSYYHREASSDPYTLQKSQLTNAAQVLREAESLYSAALKDDLPSLAPKQMRHAQWYLVRAQDAYQKMRRGMMRGNSRFSAYRANGYAEKVFNMAGKAIQNVKAANGVKQRVDLILAEAMENRARLIDIGAPQTYPQAYHKLESDLAKLMNHIAAGREQRAIVYEPRLLDSMRALEIKTLDKRYLSQAGELIASLRRSGVTRWAPQTFRAAEASLENARAFLSTNPREDDMLVEMAEEVSRHARHARNIASEVQKIKRRDTETAVLELESYLTKIGRGLNAEDMRHLPLREQAKALAERGSSLNDSVDGLQKQNQTLQARNAELERDLAVTRRSNVIQLQGGNSPRPVAPYPLPEFKIERKQSAPVVQTQRVIPLNP